MTEKVHLMGVATTALGVIGQCSILLKFLVRNYPCKLMTLPPAHFYARVGYVSVPLMLIFAGAVLHRYWTQPPISTVVPLSVGPLIPLVIYKVAALALRYDLTVKNFESTTGFMVQRQFVSMQLTIAMAGLVMGLLLTLTIMGLMTLFSVPPLAK